MNSIPVSISSALLLCLFIQCEALNGYLVYAKSNSGSNEESSSEVSFPSDSVDSGKRESCRPDEVLSECIQNDCRIESCSERGLAILCAEPVPTDQCTRGCVCPVGTLRNDEDICVPEDQCSEQEIPSPDTCPENEVISNCFQNVCGQYCSQKGYDLPCAAIAEEYCERGCICQPGYLRTEEGKCISEERCYRGLVCDENEIANSCPGTCNDFCPTSDKQGERNCFGSKPDSDSCEPKCTCRFNYRRDNNNGTCIPTRDCPPFDCSSKPNEVYNSCPPICPTDECSQATPDGRCPVAFGRIGIVLECKPACRCAPGFWRDDGVCVPYLACPGKCPPNEEYNNCSNALCRAQKCSQLGYPLACPSMSECEENCVCIEGTLRNDNGDCVPESECPVPTCGENEQLNECTNGCDSDVCPTVEELARRRDCVAPAVCGPPRCVCQPGYGRDDIGNCIPLENCPPICPPDEEFSNCTQSLCRPQYCPQLDGSVSCRRPTAEEDCFLGCVCVEGRVRGADGRCILEEQCGEEPCDENEQLLTCTNRCDSDICPTVEELARRRDCIAPAVCGRPRCMCQPGYGRDENGNCISLDSCPLICPPNEEYSTCSNALCRAQNCSELGYPVACPSVSECEGNCVCIEGTLRNENGDCVPESECTAPTCGENEQLNECTNGCDSDVCPTVEELARRRDCVAPAVCGPPRCVCQPGYGRDDIGNCIPLANCPPICPPDEEFSNCTQSLCRPQYCPQLDGSVSCRRPTAEEDCFLGCVCVEGRVRGADGRCIPEEQCGEETCNENEQLVTCTNRCDSDICPTVEELARRRDCIAPAVCGRPRCMCQPGYGRDENGNCISLDSCPPICPTNEEYSTCSNALCRAQNCSELGYPVACPSVSECEGNCVCIEGTLRNDNGDCVPESECTALTCGENEQLNECTNGCDSDVCPTVEELARRRDCVAPAVCGPPRCVCQPGFGRDDTGNCIPLENCPAICPPDEELSECVESICRPQSCSDLDECSFCRPYPNDDCSIGCVCPEGFVRGNDGRCIPDGQCGNQLTCGPNEEAACVQQCPPERTCRNKGILFDCLQTDEKCQLKCVCKDGYNRNYLGECITDAQCDQCPFEEHQFYSCGQECDNVCDNKDQNRTNCPIINIVCNQMCYCEDGYARDCQGKCIPLEECPKEVKCGPIQKS